MTEHGVWPSHATLSRIESINSIFSAVGFVSSKRITVSPPAPISCASCLPKVEVHRLRVANVQVAIRLGREARAVLAARRLEVRGELLARVERVVVRRVDALAQRPPAGSPPGRQIEPRAFCLLSASAAVVSAAFSFGAASFFGFSLATASTAEFLQAASASLKRRRLLEVLCGERRIALFDQFEAFRIRLLFRRLAGVRPLRPSRPIWRRRPRVCIGHRARVSDVSGEDF